MEDAPAPVRALRAVVHALLTSEAGYGLEEHNSGWRLVRACSEPPGEAAAPLANNPVIEAREELEHRQRTLFMRVNAALRGRHPEQRDYVLRDLSPGAGAFAVGSIESLLDRIDMLATDPARKPARKEDHAALLALAARGVTLALRKELRRLIHVYKTPVEVKVVKVEDRRQERIDALYALHVWLREWREMARAVITRKDLLVSLGIGKRARPKKPLVPPAPAPPAIPASEEVGPESRAA